MTSTVEFSEKYKPWSSKLRSLTTLVTSVGSVWCGSKLVCHHCGKTLWGECQLNGGTCILYGSKEYWKQDYPSQKDRRKE